MKQNITLFVLAMLSFTHIKAQKLHDESSFEKNPDLIIQKVEAKIHQDISMLELIIQAEGAAGNTYPKGIGTLDGAPVLGYVFPTTLSPTDVGFGDVEGITALALTSHPDFDDTPLWDENNDLNYLNDGRVWHPHWVVLVEDDRVAGGLSVRQFDKSDTTVVLPPTNPGMPMYMDSPGYQVFTQKSTIHVMVPAYRINNQMNFQFDGVTAYMQVNASDPELPMLGVYKVYSVASGDLSLPYKTR